MAFLCTDRSHNRSISTFAQNRFHMGKIGGVPPADFQKNPAKINKYIKIPVFVAHEMGNNIELQEQ